MKKDSIQRILVLPVKKDDCAAILQEGCHVADSCACCNVGIPFEEAIEKMAKANWIAVVCAKNQIIPVNVSKEEWDAEWDKLKKSFKKVYYSGAEASLKTLLRKE